MSRCDHCGAKDHDPTCPNAESPTFDFETGQVRVNADGSIDVLIENDYYNIAIDADDARKIAEAVLAKQR